jgi:hypothetical protein
VDLLNPKVKKRLQALTEEMGDKQAFVPYVLAGFLLTAYGSNKPSSGPIPCTRLVHIRK